MKTTQWSLLESPINIKINARIITQVADELKRPEVCCNEYAELS
jgi:hypothetical protein